MQTLEGCPIDVYASRDTPVTIYVNARNLSIQNVIQDKNHTAIIKYSKYREPILIEAQ
jgi:hypothetical protein